MKLDEYIDHLQELQKTYSGLDIEVVQGHPNAFVSDGTYVVPADAPKVLPVKAEDSGQLLVPKNSRPLDATAAAKKSGPDGVIFV